MAFDFLAPRWGLAPEGKKYAFTADGGPKTVGRLIDFIDNQVYGDFVIPQELIGSYNLEASQFWSHPRYQPVWFWQLNKAIQKLPKDLNKGFLVNKYFDHATVNVAENFGPEKTGAIIAKVTKLYSNLYGRIFATVVRDAAAGQGVDFANLPPIRQAQYIADLVRTLFPYAEETVGVEEITIPLRMFWFYCYYPGVQKFDCDDLTTCFMVLAESCGLPTAVRLAGDSGKTDKYHVYPVYKGPDVNHPYVFDVSAPTPWGIEMNRGENFRDFDPNNASTYESELSIKQAAGLIPNQMIGMPLWNLGNGF